MKQTATLLLFLITSILPAQVVSFDYILSQNAVKVAKVAIPKGDSVMTIPMPFNSMEITDPSKLDSLRRKPIAKIVLVYTAFKQEASFSQDELNRKRLAELQRKVPSIFENSLIDWQLVEQTGAKTNEQAHDYFHGFIVYFRGYRSVKTMTTREELSLIDKKCDECLLHCGDTIFDPGRLVASETVILDTLLLHDTLVVTKASNGADFYITKVLDDAVRESGYTGDLLRFRVSHPHITDTVTTFTYTLKKKRKKQKGVYVPRSKKKAEEGIVYAHRGVANRKLQVLTTIDTIYKFRKLYVRLDTAYRLHCTDSVYGIPVIEKDCFADELMDLHLSVVIDSVVYKTLSKKKDIAGIILVEDVTGSMAPYTMQTFMWRRATLGSTSLSNFVFFNDGDAKPDDRKKPGKTGGIYYIHSHSIDSVENCAESAMRAGNGGDCPENNMEAVIAAHEQCPDCRILMIADNYAPVKDLSLLTSDFPPIDIILCGVRDGRIQADYITIARTTGGNIYTMEGSLENVLKAKEGDKVEIGGQHFIVRDGRYILTR